MINKEKLLKELVDLEQSIIDKKYDVVSEKVDVVRNAIQFIQEVPVFIVKKPPVKKYDNEHWNEILRNIVKDFRTKNINTFYASNKELSDYIFKNYKVNKTMAKKIAWIINNLNGAYTEYIKQEFGISSAK